MRFRLFLALVGSALVGGAVLAHATLVLGAVFVTPDVPQPGQAFELSLTLEDPIGTTIEDAVVYAEFRPPGVAPGAEPTVDVQLTETAPGTYATTLSLPDAGAWTLFLRDQTYRAEEATASLVFNVGEEPEAAPTTRAFVFPPTATNPPLRIWIYWVLGVPLVAAVVVTVLVLTNSKEGQVQEA